jgi:hypothetical protein
MEGKREDLEGILALKVSGPRGETKKSVQFKRVPFSLHKKCGMNSIEISSLLHPEKTKWKLSVSWSFSLSLWLE